MAVQRRILLVDDDPSLLAVLQALMIEFSAGNWAIEVAMDTAAALSILQSKPIDLLVLDVHLPVVDGVQFLRLLQRNSPELPKVVLTGDSTGAHRQACLDNGADLFLEKPRASAGWQSVLATLDQLIRLRAGESGFRGLLRQVDLQDVLQMECLARSSSILEVTAGTASGRIYIQEGTFVHAEMGETTGEEAFNSLLALSRGAFTLQPFAAPPERTLQGPWEFLLMEAARRRDEGSGPPTRPEPGPEEVIEVAEGAAAAPILPLPARTSGPAVRTTAAVRPRVDEVLLCSARADVLYEWQSSRPESRIQLLTLLQHKARQVSQGWPAGEFDRLEVEAGGHRFLFQLKADYLLFVRSSLLAGPGTELHESATESVA